MPGKDVNVAQPRLLRRDRVLEITGLSEYMLYSLIKTGRFPRPIPLVDGGRAVAWVATEVYAWINARIETARSMDVKELDAQRQQWAGPGRGRKGSKNAPPRRTAREGAL